MKHNIVWLSLIVVAIIVALAVAMRFFNRTPAEPVPAAPVASAPSQKTP